MLSSQVYGQERIQKNYLPKLFWNQKGGLTALAQQYMIEVSRKTSDLLLWNNDESLKLLPFLTQLAFQFSYCPSTSSKETLRAIALASIKHLFLQLHINGLLQIFVLPL